MSGERQELTVKLCESKIKRIDDSLDNIHLAIEKAFDSKDSSSLSEQLGTLFQRIWGKCLGRETYFKTLNELTQYFEKLHGSIDEMVDRHFAEENLSISLISDNTKSFYKIIIQIYFAFAKQKFLLNKFKEIDYKNKFATDIKLLQGLCKKPAGQLRDANAQEERNFQINSKINSLASINFDLLEALKNNGYTRSEEDEDLEATKPKSEGYEKFASEVRSILHRLPNNQSLHKCVNDLNKAIERGDKHKADDKQEPKEPDGQVLDASDKQKKPSNKENVKSIKECIEEVNKVIKALQSSKDDLERCYRSNIPKQEEILEKWLEEGEVVYSTIELANRMAIMQVVRTLSAIMGNTKNKIEKFDDISISTLPLLGTAFVEVCTKQSSKKLLSIPFWSTQWDSLAANVKTEFDDLSQDLTRLVSSYNPYFHIINEITDDFKLMHEDAKKLENKRMEFAGLLGKTKCTFQATVNSITTTQKILSTYLQVPPSFIKDFLSNHWLLMLGGGVVSGGIATAVAILTFSNPVTLSIVASAGVGFLFGIAVAAAIGMIKDECCPPPPPVIPEQKQLFTPNLSTTIKPDLGQVAAKPEHADKSKDHRWFLFKRKKQTEHTSEEKVAVKKNIMCPT